METLKLRIGDILRSTTGRVMLALYLFCTVICVGFIAFIYFSQIENSIDAEFSKLEAIANSVSAQIDGDKHQLIFNQYQMKDEIANVHHCEVYKELHTVLRQVREKNNLDTDIYTLVLDEQKQHFKFVVTSAVKPYFRHVWKEFSSEHLELYKEGAGIGPYEDEHGIWLSAFTPIVNSNGETVAIVQVDEPFDPFVAAARSAIRERIILLIGVFAVLGLFMLIYIQKILSKEENLKNVLHDQRNEISAKNREITSSINRAKFIQDALLPDQRMMKNIFPEMFILFQPRDIVSGDFYWFAEKGDSVYMAVVDCTGHGVPGGFMSMIGHTILNEVINHSGAVTPAEVLKKLDGELADLLLSKSQKSRDGMDIALIRYCKKTRSLEFSGALRPMVRVSQERFDLIRGDKFSIGGFNDTDKTFTNHKVDVQPGDSIYLFSDGYSDQFGGDRNKKYKSRRFYEFMEFAQDHPLEEQKYLFSYEFHHWRQEEAQIDDMLVMGVKIPDAA